MERGASRVAGTSTRRQTRVKAPAPKRDAARSTGAEAPEAVNPSDALAQLHFAPGHLLRRARQFHDALWLELVGGQLTPLQFAALTALAAEPGLNQRELGERIALDKSTLGDLVTRLARYGYLTRRPDPRDARSRVLAITPAGRATLARTRPAVVQIGRTILGCLEPDERRQFTNLLAKLVFSDLALQTTNNANPMTAENVERTTRRRSS